MRPFTDAQIRASFINASLRERKAIILPDLAAIAWEDLTYLGWRDPKLPNVGYVVVDLGGADRPAGADGSGGEPVGMLLRQTESRTRTRPQCTWCADVQLPNDVAMFSTRRAGDAGRRGDVIGSLVCENFECSANVRRTPVSAYLGYDVDAARQRRMDSLRANVESFARDVRGSR